jgi:hypothetical protein
MNFYRKTCEPPDIWLPQMDTDITDCPLNLGRRGTTGQNYKGLMGKVSLYNRALTESEIREEFERGTEN